MRPTCTSSHTRWRLCCGCICLLLSLLLLSLLLLGLLLGLLNLLLCSLGFLGQSRCVLGLYVLLLLTHGCGLNSLLCSIVVAVSILVVVGLLWRRRVLSRGEACVNVRVVLVVCADARVVVVSLNRARVGLRGNKE